MVNRRSPATILACFITLQAALCLLYSLTRLYSLRGSAYDIGAYLQVLSSIVATGTPLVTLHPLGSGEIHWFGFHFSPILYAIAPLYALFPSPVLLETISTLCISLATIPVFFAARALGLTPKSATVAALAYLFNPFTLNAGIWGFQEPVLAVPFVALAVWAIAVKRFRWLCAASCMLLLVKEHYGISVVAFGLLWYLRHNDKRGLLLATFGALAFALVMAVIMPHFRGGFVHPMLTAGTASDRYGWLLSPQEWLGTAPFVLKGDLEYGFLLMFFFAALPLLGARWLLAGSADFLVVVLSMLPSFRSPFSDYSLALMPVVTIAACAGYMHIRHRLRRDAVSLCASIILVAYAFFSCLPLPFAADPLELPAQPQLALAPHDAQAVQAIGALLPPDSALSVQDTIGMFFNQYRKRYVFPENKQPVDATVLWLASPRHYVALGANPVDTRHYLVMADTLLNDDSQKVIYWQAPWLVMSPHGEDIPGAREQALQTLDRLAAQQANLLGIVRQQ